MPSATSAAVGWSVVFLVAGGLYYASNQRRNKNRRALSTKAVPSPPDSRRETKLKKPRKDFGPARGKNEARNNRKAQKTSIEHESSQSLLIPENYIEAGNCEPESQHLSVKTSTVASANSQSYLRSKSVKQRDDIEQQDQFKDKQRAESSGNATGNEADDEAVLNFPKLGGSTSKSFAATPEVSDMLERAPTQPSILKVSAPTSNNTNQSETRKVAERSERTETKKQRQNRQKTAEAKLVRAQEEQMRKIKMENQRRTAREAEGRPAKDGSLFMASQNSSTTWATLSSNLNGNMISASESLYSESEGTHSAHREMSALSEEEQVRHAIKETETWSVVKGKDKRNRAVKGDDSEFSKLDTKTQENSSMNSGTCVPTVLNQQDASNYSMKEKAQFAEENIVIEDSEWEVS